MMKAKSSLSCLLLTLNS